MMITPSLAQSFATDWIEAWNTRNLDRVLAHYRDDFEMNSPMIISIAGEPSGSLRGKASVRAYWETALQVVGELRLELISILIGVGTIILYYRGAKGRLAAEIFHFGEDQKVVRAFAHYELSMQTPS